MNVTELADGGRTAALTNDERISKLLSFIPSYDPSGLVPLGDADLLSLYVEELIGDEEYRLLNLLTGPDGKTIHEELSKQFDELKEVRKAITNPQMRTKDATWDSLDRVLMNFSSTLLRYGKDVYHYGADLASRAVHPTAYYNKGWKLSSFQEGDWEQIVESLDNLSISIYDASVGNMTGSLERSEAAGITLEKLLRGNDVEPLQLKYADAESAPPSSDYSPAIVPSPFASSTRAIANRAQPWQQIPLSNLRPTHLCLQDGMRSNPCRPHTTAFWWHRQPRSHSLRQHRQKPRTLPTATSGQDRI